MARTIAPELEAWLHDCDAHGLHWHRRMGKDYRALLAVARAAGRLATYLQTEVPADEWMPVDAALARAYVRLERLSSRASRERE